MPKHLEVTDFFLTVSLYLLGLPSGTAVKNPLVNTEDKGDLGQIPGLRRSPGVGNGNLLQYFLPGKSHGQRSLAGYSSWGHRVRYE